MSCRKLSRGHSVDDCGDDSDELGCGYPETIHTSTTSTVEESPRVCGDLKFQCYNGDCIKNSWMCDGSKDCPGGEDELYCHYSQPGSTNNACREAVEYGFES